MPVHVVISTLSISERREGADIETKTNRNSSPFFILLPFRAR